MPQRPPPFHHGNREEIERRFRMTFDALRSLDGVDAVTLALGFAAELVEFAAFEVAQGAEPQAAGRMITTSVDLEAWRKRFALQ